MRRQEAALPSNDTRALGLRILLDGIPVSGAMEAEVGTTARRAAGWFHVQLSLGADAALTAAILSTITDATIEVQVSLDGGDSWTSLITGPLDDIALDPLQGIAHLTGRDYAALFIDSVNAESFANQTASEIVETLALRRGLLPVVTSTMTPIGRYYQLGHDTLSLHRSSGIVTEWDLLQMLALAENFELSLSGNTLLFGPPTPALVPTSWQLSALLDLKLERSLAFARDLSVTVQSWNAKQARMISQTVQAHGDNKMTTAAGPRLAASNYVLVRPNMTPDQAQALGVQTLADLNRHERVAHATMSGELLLVPGSTVLLTGTNTEFDELYVAEEIERRISLRDGFTQTVRAVNAPISTTGGAP
jgi:hypothetical protein